MSKSKALTTTKRAGLPAQVIARVKRYASKSKSDNTQTAYKKQWLAFTMWANSITERGDERLTRLARETVATVEDLLVYLTALADNGSSVSNIEQARAGIAFYSQARGLGDVTKDERVKAVMSGIRREKHTAPRMKAALTRADLHTLIATIDTATLTGARDKALLILGWEGAFRRSEIAALDVEDIRMNGDMKVTLRKSKTDQEGAGMVKVIPANDDTPGLCPLRSMRSWLDASGIKSGAIFRRVDRWGHMRDERLTSQSVALVIKHYATLAGLEARQLSGHSLRSGFVTSAISAGAAEHDVMQMTGHKSQIVLRRYIRDAGLGAKRAARAARSSNGSQK